MIAISLLALCVAFLGHAVILVFTMNWVYGCPFPKWVMSPIRKIYALLILLGWAYVGYWLVRLDLEWTRFPLEAPVWLWIYICLAWLAGLVLFPLATWNNSRIRRPPALLSDRTVVVNMVETLGFRPIGLGKHRALGRLPFNQIFEVDFSERTLRLANLPEAWQGMRILHVSDFHFCGTPDRPFYQHVIQRCNQWQADIVAVSGDYVDTNQHHRWIAPILGRLTWKSAAFAILGNHDAWRDHQAIRRRLRRVGFQVLGNSWKSIEFRGHKLTVIGHEGPWFRPAPDLRECPEAEFRMCVSHTPDNLPWARRNAIDLVLAGHVHGGQIRLPVFGSIFVPSKFGRRYDMGTFQEGPTVMHVSRGLAGEFPLRINCRPEVNLLVLSK